MTSSMIATRSISFSSSRDRSFTNPSQLRKPWSSVLLPNRILLPALAYFAGLMLILRGLEFGFPYLSPDF